MAVVQAVMNAGAVGLYWLWSCCIAVTTVEKMMTERTKAGTVRDATARYSTAITERLRRPSRSLSEQNTRLWKPDASQNKYVVDIHVDVHIGPQTPRQDKGWPIFWHYFGRRTTKTRKP